MFLETADIETASSDYATRFSGKIGEWFLARQTKLLLSLLPENCKTAIDVGGGHGQIASPLCKAGIKVTVTGSSEQCKERLKGLLEENSSCSFVIADNINLPFPDKSFDLATSFRLLPHCERWQKLISELCRVSRICVIVDYPSLESVNIFAEKFFKLKKKVEKNTRPFRIFTHREIENSFRENGFVPKRRLGEFLFPMALHRAIGSKVFSQLIEMPFDFFKITNILGSPVIARMDRV